MADAFFQRGLVRASVGEASGRPLGGSWEAQKTPKIAVFVPSVEFAEIRGSDASMRH